MQELIRRGVIGKVTDRDHALDPGVMGVKCNEIVNAQIEELLEHQGGVHGFTSALMVLTAFIQEGHDHGDPFGSASDGGNHPFQIHEVIIGRHMVDETVHRICDRIVCDIHQDIDILAADRSFDDRPAFAGLEPVQIDGDPVIFLIIAFHQRVVMGYGNAFSAESADKIIHLAAELLGGRQHNKPDWSNGKAAVKLLV